ncbi:mandelate racemase/muconate lactonizing enzyme family protein [Pigmentiphaga soli]|uniref:Mandelate racemase/muconate lactonizing enzyme family protein n=1 Tax=Pigmentiphaga soli TaxID=1007095 RepID=A0ABP8HSP1_9BURK
MPDAIAITAVRAHALRVPLQFDHAGVRRKTSMSCCLVEIDTDAGLQGHGLAGITQERVAAYALNEIIGPALLGRNPLEHEAIWEDLYWELTSRGQGGWAVNAISAVDVALWDLKGKAAGQPVWRLLGAARPQVPVYLTFGFPFLDTEALTAVARHFRQSGFDHLKMVVGDGALRNRRRQPDLKAAVMQDVARVQAVRAAVGGAAQLYIDANCNLDYAAAETLALAVADCHIGYFEEPVTQNDVPLMRKLRDRTGIAVASGQCETVIHRFRDMLAAQAVDYVQPNVVIGGGFTQAARVAGLAAGFNVPVTNGGGYPIHNMHLHAGLANGGMVEWHLPIAEMMRVLFEGFPVPQRGMLALPEAPGLGFSVNRDAVAAHRI